MTSFKAKLSAALDKLLASEDAQDPNVRQARYQRARDLLVPAFARMEAESGPAAAAEARQLLEDVIAEKETRFSMTDTHQEAESGRNSNEDSMTNETVSQPVDGGSGSRSSRNGFAVGAVCALVLAAVIFGVAYLGGFVSLSGAGDEARTMPLADLAKSQPIIDETIAALREVRSTIEATGIENIPNMPEQGKVGQLAKVFPEIDKKLSDAVKQNVDFIVLASGPGYKVLGRSEMCPLLALGHPEFVDRKRTNFEALCYQFGIWNEAGQNF